MRDKTFVDTNVLIYAHDRDAGGKRAAAAAILEGLWEGRNGVLSAQVLEEFYVNVTRKIPRPLSSREAREIIDRYLMWEVLPIEGEMVAEASRLEERSKISFWDSLIILAALRSGATVLLTEDLQDGRKMGDLTIRNPFAARG